MEYVIGKVPSKHDTFQMDQSGKDVEYHRNQIQQ